MDDEERVRVGIIDFAQRCFRDSADRDYIGARLAYRAGLFQQFLWLAQQALEKYLKYVILTHRIDGRKVGHVLGRALVLVERHLFPLDLLPVHRKFIAYLDEIGPARYLERSWWLEGDELPCLDATVWAIRRYCRYVRSAERLRTSALDAGSAPGGKFQITGGVLEAILKKPRHPARGALVWKNLAYGARRKKRISLDSGLAIENSPLFVFPEAIEEACKYVHLPHGMAEGARLLALQRQQDRQQEGRG